MPFGLTSDPTTFQRALDVILSASKWQICLVYLNNVIILSANAEQHVKDVDMVLHRLREAGVTLNFEMGPYFFDKSSTLDTLSAQGKCTCKTRTLMI